MGSIQIDLPVEGPFAVVTRPAPDRCSPPQTIVLADGPGRNPKGFNCFQLLGAHRLRPHFAVGPPLPLMNERGEAYVAENLHFAATYDPYSNAVYFSEGEALMCLSPSNVITRVAGIEDASAYVDGPGDIARFEDMTAIAPDGEGGLVIADRHRLRRVQPGVGLGRSSEGPVKRLRTSDVAGSARVATLYTRPDGVPWTELAYDAATATLIATTDTAVYRLRMPPNSLTAAADGDAAPGSGARSTCSLPLAPAPPPLLVAGVQSIKGDSDGTYTSARFTRIDGGLAVDGRGGAAWMIDKDRLRRVDLDDGCVTTVRTDLSESSIAMSVLPNGCLAVCDMQSGTLNVIALDLSPPLPSAAPATPQADAWSSASGLAAPVATAALAAPTNLASVSSSACAGHPAAMMYDRLQALGDQDPTADVTLRLLPAGARFRAHKAVLAASSDYFYTLFFGSGSDASFVESSSAAAELDLPEVDPAALAVLLRYCYCHCPEAPGTDLLPYVPPALLRPVAALADRLLLPAPVLEEAQRRLLAATWPSTVVDDLLWAEERGPRFERLRKGLRTFQARYAKEVMEQARDSVRRLAERRLDLILDMYDDLANKAGSGGGGDG